MATRDDQRLLIRLARKGKIDGDDGLRQKLTELLKSGFTGEDLDFNEKPYFRSALWEATWKNYKPIVQLLTEKKANLQFADYQGRTPLHEAAFYGHEQLVTYLVEAGHDVNITDSFGQSPLFRACEGSRVQVIEYLIKKGASLNLVDCDSVSVANMMGFQGQAENADFLLYKGAWKNRYHIEQPGPPKPPPKDLLGIDTEPAPEAAKPAADGAPAAAAVADGEASTAEKGV